MAGQNGPNNTDDPIWIMVMAMVLLLLFLYLLSIYFEAFNAIYGSIAWAHIYPFAMLGEFVPFTQRIPIVGPLLIAPSVEINQFLLRGDFSKMTFEGAGSARAYVLTIAGRVAFLIYTPFLVRAIFAETQVHIDQKYKRKHSLESMVFEQAKSFPTIRMFKHLNPIESRDLMPRDFTEGAIRQIKASKGDVGNLITGTRVMIRPSGFTRSINPEEWLVSNGLVMDQELFETMTSGMFPAEDRDFYFEKEWEKLTIASLSEVLENQLATPWTKPENLPIHIKALFAVMTMFYGYDLKGGTALLDELGLLAEQSVIKKVKMKELIAQSPSIMKKIDAAISSKEGKQMAQMASQHAWVESALPTLLRKARFQRGVLASASFIWLKREDRVSWYILNATGNEAVNIEAAGAMAHNRAEMDFGSPLYVPHVYQAARSILHDYLDCRPDRMAARKLRREGAIALDEQIRLMSMDAEQEIGQRMNISYEKDET